MIVKSIAPVAAGVASYAILKSMGREKKTALYFAFGATIVTLFTMDLGHRMRLNTNLRKQLKQQS